MFAAKDYLKPGQCQFCKDQPSLEHCVQIVKVTPKPLDPALLGNGVSFAPPEAQLPPAHVRNQFLSIKS